jgi:serine/threonine-protein kinase RsbW
LSEIVRLTIPAKAEYLVLARLVLTGIALEVPMSEVALADLKLAVTEVCGNAVQHAYEDDPGVVRVVFQVEPEAIEVSVKDEGTAAALSDVDDEAVLGDEPAESGMGLAIVRAVMDEVAIDGDPASPGTVVRMRKSLEPA